MSELNVYHHELRPDEYDEFYLKYEADKVIAEKDNEIAGLKEGAKNLILDNYLKDKEIKHHKYKRSIAMANWCEERYNYLTCLENWQMTDKEYQQVIGDYWDRWHKRWLKIAEQFKEAK